MQSSRDRYPLVVVASPSNGELTTCPIYPCASSRGSAVHAAKCLPKVSKPAFTWQSASLLGNSSNLNLNHILHGLRQSCCPLYRSQIIHSRTRHHPDVQEDDYMDIDDLEEGESKLTCPGETITSAHDFMRWVRVMERCRSVQMTGVRKQWPWYLHRQRPGDCRCSRHHSTGKQTGDCEGSTYQV